ncbi:MAG TPA: PAS domain S-box protein [Allosphingosinicella sp.]
MADQSAFSSPYIDERFQLLVNSVTDYALYMLDVDGHIVTWNPGARRFKGYEAEEIIGQHFSRFFTPEDREAGRPERALRIAAAEGKFESEGWRVRKDGTRFWAHVVVDPIRDAEGRLAGFAKITRDITEKRAQERALYESEQRFRLLVQGVSDYAIYMLDPDGTVTNWNAGAEAIKGYKADEIVGQHFSRFYTEEDRANGEPARALATALREGKYEREAWRVRKDGTRFFANVVIDPIYTEAGELAGFAKVTRDITQRRQAEQELEEARAALFQSQKLQALGELTGGIAHDFNNLMTVIRGSADLLRRDDLSADKRLRYLDAIVETADRAATLTSHLLAFGRRQTLKPEVIDVNLRLDAIAGMLSRTLGSRVDVTLDLAHDAWNIEADPTQLETALLNAAINARDAMPDGGRLTLASANVSGKDGEFVCIAVSDTGCGMPQEVIDRAFEPFFTTKPVGKGTGLGLSQIHGFAAQTGGKVEIRSRVGEGSTIRLLLPRSRKTAQERAAHVNAPVLPPGITVLLVEDNDQVRNFARHLLREIGCGVRCAGSGEEALSILEKEAVDLVFSDVVMPGMSGIELARRVREARPDMPFLLASGYSEEVIEGAAAEYEVVRKPYGAETLGDAIARALSHGDVQFTSA